MGLIYVKQLDSLSNIIKWQTAK